MHRHFFHVNEQINLFLARSTRLFLAVSLLGAWALPALAGTFSAKVVSVTDGDTLTIMHDGAREKLILFGIDCPELAQEFGPQAKKFTDDCCYGKVVSVEEHGRDPRGRTIAVIHLPDGSNLNQELVRQGLAWWSDKFAPDDAQLQQLHTTAKTAHAGLWSAPNPIPPWIFRNGERGVQATIMPK
jgi:micrococcal nuclease